jgi:hypothetical protein
LDDKVQKYKKLKESIQDTVLNLEQTNLFKIENANFRTLCEEIFPYFMVEELDFNIADLDVDETLDYMTEHILETPWLIQ